VFGPPICARLSKVRCCFSALVAIATCSGGQIARDNPVPTFGTTVVESAGLRGQIYLLPQGATSIPNFKRRKAVGTIYTTRLNIPPRDFREGFPGITGRLEWFAIDYAGHFFISSRAKYRFGLLSDDGAKLYIDGRSIIDNDGIHPPSGCTADVELEAGVHSIRLTYMQGPGLYVALQLTIARPGESWRIFDTRDFMSPDEPGQATGVPGKKGVRKVSGGDCWAGR
jgi:hypothetical protein